MPTKDYRTLGEDLVNVAVRLTASTVAKVDTHVQRLREGARWAKVGRSDALRDLVLRGLQSLESNQGIHKAQALPEPTVPAVQEALRTEEMQTVPQPYNHLEVKSALIARCRTMQEAGLSYKQIARALATDGVPTLSGRGRWHPGTVENLVKG